ncbi:accessory gene regulator B family protein [Petroclostridium sp. X23]|uniref:accessory gene regulator B family protein n=1 Tax=Petroclostridium sp. X23 TaxID=3045146 RepID=UPI0024ACA591|nr:accessory gene regulator B family protein [Petroclostridium sp. X23]WHH59197.1 accessory gene regulator B family protein [Petroclostridium sp. X23]
MSIIEKFAVHVSKNVDDSVFDKIILNYKTIKGRDITQEQAISIFIYKLHTNISFCISVILVFLISCVINTTIEAALIYLSFLALRKTTGGPHLNNEYMCLIVTTSIISISGYIAKFLPLNIVAINISFFILIIVVTIIGYIDHKSNRLDQSQKSLLKKYALSIISFLWAVSAWKINATVSICFMISAIIQEINLVIGKILAIREENFVGRQDSV